MDPLLCAFFVVLCVTILKHRHNPKLNICAKNVDVAIEDSDAWRGGRKE